MEQNKKPNYKYCIVPMCKNTTRNAPGKLFFLVPRGVDRRRKWCEIMKREMISPSTCLYCCEDHFNIEDDTVNYIQYKIMTLQGNKKTILRLKKGILPHKFECQKDNKSKLPLKKKGFQQKKLDVIEDDLSPAVQSAVTTEPSQNKSLKDMKACQPCQMGHQRNSNQDQYWDVNLTKPEQRPVPGPECDGDVKEKPMVKGEESVVEPSGGNKQFKNAFGGGLSSTLGSNKASATSSKNSDCFKRGLSPLAPSPVVEPVKLEIKSEASCCGVCYQIPDYICGYRYVCLECMDSEICETCYSDGQHSLHYVLRMPIHKPWNEVKSVLKQLREGLLEITDSEVELNYNEKVESQSIDEDSGQIIVKEEPDFEQDLENDEQMVHDIKPNLKPDTLMTDTMLDRKIPEVTQDVSCKIEDVKQCPKLKKRPRILRKEPDLQNKSIVIVKEKVNKRTSSDVDIESKRRNELISENEHNPKTINVLAMQDVSCEIEVKHCQKMKKKNDKNPP